MDERCRLCRGLCCQRLALKVGEPEAMRWLSYRGEMTAEGWVEFPLWCRKLVGGKCSIYEDRPVLCREFEVGGALCLSVVRRYGNRKVKQVMGV